MGNPNFGRPRPPDFGFPLKSIIMPSFSLSPKASDWFIAAYLTLTLALRFYLEPQLQSCYMVSVGVGLFALLFLWALVKSGFLQPTFFGFFPPAAAKGEQS
jgi:hypothetical protein